MDSVQQEASKGSLIAWSVITAIFFIVELLSGITGILTAMLPVAIPSNVPFYIQCATSITALMLSLCETGLLVTVVRWVKWKTNAGKRFNGSLHDTNIAASHRDFSICHMFQLYFGFIGVNAAVLIIVWCLTIIYSYKNSSLEGSLWPFIAIEIGWGIISPILILCSLLPILRVIRYVSCKKIETRRLLIWFLPFLGYEHGVREVYWVVNDSFYFKIDKKRCGNLSTILIYTITALTFLLSWVYFVSDAIISQSSIPNCLYLTERDRESSYCFRIHPTNTNMYINCTEYINYSGRLFCFEFKQFGKDFNLIQSFVISIFLYYITTFCISITFNIMKVVIQHARSYLWSTFLILTGILAFLIGIPYFVTAYYLYTNLDILVMFQVIVISANIIIVGILLSIGHPMSNNHQFYPRNNINPSPTSLQPHMSDIESMQISQEVDVVRHDLPPPSSSPAPPIHVSETESDNVGEIEHQLPSLPDTTQSTNNDQSAIPMLITERNTQVVSASPTVHYYQAPRPKTSGIHGQTGQCVVYYTYPRQPTALTHPIPVSDPHDRHVNVESGFGMLGRKVTIV